MEKPLKGKARLMDTQYRGKIVMGNTIWEGNYSRGENQKRGKYVKQIFFRVKRVKPVKQDRVIILQLVNRPGVAGTVLQTPLWLIN